MRSPVVFAAAGLALFVSGCATTPSAAPVAETVLDAESGYIVHASARGRPLRLKVDPGAPWFVLLNGSVAKELRLVGTRGATMAVGPVKLKGKTRSEKFTFGTTQASRPVMWFNGEAIRGADGVINPANLPDQRVTLRLGAPRPDEQTIELSMRFDKERGLYFPFSFGGQILLTRFTLLDQLTTATGAAASVIAKRRNGIWQGDSFSHPVRYGVTRPVRKMVLGEPLSLKGFALSDLAVRVWDDRGSYRLPEKELPEPADVDEDSIVITGERRGIFGMPHFWLMIGRDDLTRCSSVSYDNRSRRLILRCSPADV